MTYYHDHPSSPYRPRTLIELIPDSRDDLDVSDEESSFYGREDDFLIPPKWQNRIADASDRIPKRIKRCSFVVLAAAFLALFSWWTYFGPRHAAHMAELHEMDKAAPADTYGNNVRPVFKDMIQVSDLDKKHLPKKGSKLVFVGDVHGCREELEHLLKKVDFSHKHDHLVLTGDMVSKGPDSPGVVKLMQKIGASCVRGNWEDKLLLAVQEAQQHRIVDAGHDAKQEDDYLDEEILKHVDPKLRKLAKKFKKSQLEFLQQCPVILRVGNVDNLGNLVVVHAGLVPNTPLERQDPFHVMNMRTIDLKTRIPSSKHSGTPWEKFWNHQQKKLDLDQRATIVYGHNRKRGLNIREYSFGLDTGCVNGGHLTALVVGHDGKTEIVSVKCKKEKGYESQED